MKRHRNSQKRIYAPDGVYFITTNTHDGYPYFNHDVLCDLFVEELRFCQKLKGFGLFAYKINPQHIHLLIQHNQQHDFSDIMQFLKRNFSRNANRIIGVVDVSKGDEDHRRLLWATRNFDRIVERLRTQFITQYGSTHHFPPFKWQKSFHFHIVNGNRDFYNHVQYIRDQWVKHRLIENKYCFVHPEVFCIC